MLVPDSTDKRSRMIAASKTPALSLRHSWKFIVAEMMAIIFGVFLGVWISALVEDREIEQFVERSRQVMLQELEENYTRIERAREYHLGLLPDVVAARDALLANETFEPFDYRGFGAPLVTTAAYDTALSAATFARVDPAEASRIAFAYEQIANMRSVMENYRLAVATRDSGFVALISTAFADSLYAEDAALRAIAAVIEKTPPPVWTSVLDVRPY
ncbi:MAG: hypothetical protein AAGJ86_05580 [Pseudomonadota bacterium]